MRLSSGEIKARAKAFAEDWADAHYEKGETQTFYNEFFAIFGVRRRQVAAYEQRVKLLSAKHGFIDLFWPGTLLIEQKSAGKNLITAQGQALDYFDAIRPDQQPRYILACDFQTFKLLDLETGHEDNFALSALHEKISIFSFILGRQRRFDVQVDVDIRAAEIMGSLHDAFEATGYVGHDLESLLVRLLFCLFADDTGIFEPKDIFLSFLEEDTKGDGSDVGRALIELFDVLDTHETKRQSNLRDELSQFAYINGGLFQGSIRTPSFDRKMRDKLIEAARFNWTKVSPAIFGSLFQSAMDSAQRRAKGAHYTTETNILKVIGPLFMDDLRAEFERIAARRTNRTALLIAFQKKLGALKFLDPACGCGNFLIIAYRELRKLELDVIRALRKRTGVIDGYAVQQTDLDIAALSVVTVGQFHRIEFEEFPSRIAEVAMWMTDHLANNELSLAFGRSYARIPLTESPHIRHGDALEFDWNDLLPTGECNYVMGNPPFLGAKYQSDFQRVQVRRIAGLGGSGGTLDYVAAWFIKASQYAAKGGTRIGFVSTNSITQGEQVAQLWPIVFDRHGMEIAFAHRTFVWNSEARGTAHVHVVIIGLTHRDNEPDTKRLFSYPEMKADPIETHHGGLTAYLFDARTVANRHLVIREEARPINGARRLVSGSQPIDGGHYIFTAEERTAFLKTEPQAKQFLRRYVGAEDYINGGERWILALQSAKPDELRKAPKVLERMNLVRNFRKTSKRHSTIAIADLPARYNVEVLPQRPFLVIPEVSSERRDYVPIGWLDPPTIPSNKLRILPDATFWEFGILTSRMHMAWTKGITGRLKSDIQYGIGIVYNSFPWPTPSTAQQDRVQVLARAVLNARLAHNGSSLADLYDPNTMPADLRAAHTKLDGAVDKLYRPEAFASDRDRVEHLFGRYEKMIDPMGRTAAIQNQRVARKRAVAITVT